MSTIKISELATSAISLSDFFAKADASGLANKNTMQGLSNFINTVGEVGFKGKLLVSDIPNADGWYFAGQSGTYTNAGGLVIDITNQLVIVIVSNTQTVFSKVDIPLGYVVTDEIITNSTDIATSGGVENYTSHATKLLIGNTIIDKDYSYNDINPWVNSGTSSMTWNDNVNEFSTGKKYVDFNQNGIGTRIDIEIPDEYKIVGLKLTVALKYKSTNDVAVKGYFRNGGLWVNNGAGVDKVLNKSDEETIFYITRPYENTVTDFAIFLNQNSSANIKAGYVQLYADIEGSENITETIIDINNSGSVSRDLITNALRGITDASETNRYIIKVKASSFDYEETDITGTNYQGENIDVVKIVGENRKGVKIVTNGAWTENVGANYSVPAYANYDYNNIPIQYKHTFWNNRTLSVENLTIESTDVKYCAHIDNGDLFSVKFKNCVFKKINTTNVTEVHVIGIGQHSYQYLNFEDCVGISEVTATNSYYESAFFFWHNWDVEPASVSFNAKDCRAINSHILIANDLGSGSQNTDTITLNNCSSNMIDKGVIYNKASQNTPNYYNIVINYINTNINFIELGVGREQASLEVMNLNNYQFGVMNRSGVTILKGTPVKVDYSHARVNELQVVKANDSNYDYVAWKDILDNQIGYAVPKGKTVRSLCAASGTTTYFKGETLSINSSGLFFKSSVNVAAMVIKQTSISVDGLVRIILK